LFYLSFQRKQKHQGKYWPSKSSLWIKLISIAFCFREAWYKSIRCFGVRQVRDQWTCIPHIWHLSSSLCKFLSFSCLGSCVSIYSDMASRLFKGLSLLLFHLFFPYLYPLVLSCLLDKGSIHFKEWFRTCGMALMIFHQKFIILFSHKKKHEISSEYLLKLHSLYCCCGTIFEAWKVKNVFSNIWYHVIFSPHNLSYEVILKGAKLYSLTDLKSCNLKCNQL